MLTLSDTDYTGPTKLIFLLTNSGYAETENTSTHTYTATRVHAKYCTLSNVCRCYYLIHPFPVDKAKLCDRYLVVATLLLFFNGHVSPDTTNTFYIFLISFSLMTTIPIEIDVKMLLKALY